MLIGLLGTPLSDGTNDTAVTVTAAAGIVIYSTETTAAIVTGASGKSNCKCY